ncbi:hypothetical protein A2U01_0099785, partial [Trifolium medium]|nr:hypothetical protein [Trifolium medium]
AVLRLNTQLAMGGSSRGEGTLDVPVYRLSEDVCASE